MKIFISTADRSGDFHGALLAAALKKENQEVDLCGVGGELMAKEGVRILVNPVPRAVIGFFEVVRSLPDWKKFLQSAVDGAIQEQPDRIVLIDSPGFNFRLARRLKSGKFHFVYYISPQVWAWGKKRVSEIASFCKKVLVIFPFEKELYQKAGVPSTFVGHPFLDIVKPALNRTEALRFFGLSPERPILLLLPGSRHSEVQSLFPLMSEVSQRLVRKYPVQVVAYPASNEITQHLSPVKGVQIITGGDKYSLFSLADCALAASGSVTLELTLLSVPFVLLYRLSSLTYFLLRPMVHVPYAGITNILAGKELVPEFIQYRCRSERILPEVEGILGDENRRELMKKNMEQVKALLGEPGGPGRAAREILN